MGHEMHRLPFLCAPCRIAEGMYEDPQLQDNPAYGTSSVHKEDEQEATYYETCIQETSA